jgi:hypothetical protein
VGRGFTSGLPPVVLIAVFLLPGVLAGCGGHTSRASAPVRDRATPDATHEPDRTVGEFGKPGSGAGEFEEPFGIAIDHRSGDVYVVDTNHVRIEKFTSAGRFLLAWGWGVADGKARALQRCTSRCFAGISGGGAGQFDFPEGIAVDNDPSSSSFRDVYVVDIRNRRVEKFDRRGRFLLMFGGSVNRTARKHHNHAAEDICPVRPGDICGSGVEGSRAGHLDLHVEGSFIAVGGKGTVYVGERSSVKTFSQSGAYVSRIELSPGPVAREGLERGDVSALAVNDEGDLYVVRQSVRGVNKYAPSGKLLQTLEPGGAGPSYPEGPTPSLALDSAGNLFIDVYAHYKHRIDEYDPRGIRIASFDKGPEAPPGIADKEDALIGMAYNPRTRRLYILNADVNVRPVVQRVRILDPPRP